MAKLQRAEEVISSSGDIRYDYWASMSFGASQASSRAQSNTSELEFTPIAPPTGCGIRTGAIRNPRSMLVIRRRV